MKNFEQLNVENLLFKVESFYKKFYINRLLLGIIFSTGIILSFFLAFDLLFYFNTIPYLVRFLMFYGLILIFLSAVYYWIIIPILKLFRFSKGISNEDVASFVGGFYPQIGDKLLNTLQYNELESGNSLAKAAILQKAQFLNPFDFSKAVPQVRQNKNVFLFLFPISFFLGIFFFNANIITEGSERLVNYEVDYSAIAPFQFKVFPGDVKVSAGSDVVVRVKLVGNELPEIVYIDIDGTTFRTTRNGSVFSYEIKNISQDLSYQFSAGKFSSYSFSVLSIAHPEVSTVDVVVVYPDYLNKDNLTLQNPTQFEVIKGARVFWNFGVNNSNNGVFRINGEENAFFTPQKATWRLETLADESFDFSLMLKNRLESYENAYHGTVVVLEDQYPSIKVNYHRDSTGYGKLYCVGSVQDDFGFYSLKAKFSSNDSVWFTPIPIQTNVVTDVFSLEVDPNILTSNTKVEFLIRDNDKVGGYKLTKSMGFNMVVLSSKELDSTLIEESEDLIKEMESLVKEANKLNKNTKELRKELLNKKDLDWKDDSKLKELVKDNKELNERIKDSHKKLKNHQEKLSKENDPSSKILEKQKQLDELFEKLTDEKTKELYKELEELLKQLDKEKIQDHLDKMEMNQKDLEKELDRNLEIFKQMELEQGLEKVMDKLVDLAEKQEELAKDNEEKNITDEENIKKQEELNKEFEDIQKEMERLDSLNNELKEPNELDLKKDKQEEIAKDQKESIKKSKEKNSKESSQKQKDAAKKMKEMEDEMEGDMAMNSSSQEGEDLEALRKLLENLLVLSFKQEELMLEIRSVDKSDPRVVWLNQEQKQLLVNSEMVKDSLYALSSRVSQLESMITEEVKHVTTYMNSSVANLAERRLPQTSIDQQKALTSINNLAVLLDDIIQQLQEQQKKKNKGKGSCSKPGEGKPKPSLKSSKKKQEELAKQIEALKKKMKKGKTPGKMNPGKVGSGMSKQIAEMAAQQEMIRQEIRKMAEQLDKEGNANGAGELKKLEEMLEQNEEDLINMELTREFFERQQDIDVKMLEAQNAERKREKEQKRESETAVNYKKENTPSMDEYLKKKEFELELLRMFNPELSGYYKQRVKDYNLKSE